MTLILITLRHLAECHHFDLCVCVVDGFVPLLTSNSWEPDAENSEIENQMFLQHNCLPSATTASSVWVYVKMEV